MKQNLGPVSTIFVSLLKLHLRSLGAIEGRERMREREREKKKGKEEKEKRDGEKEKGKR